MAPLGLPAPAFCPRQNARTTGLSDARLSSNFAERSLTIMPRGSAPLIPRGLCAYVFAGANTAAGRRADARLSSNYYYRDPQGYLEPTAVGPTAQRPAPC